MAKKTIIWSNYAENQLLQILTYYLERNGNAKYSQKILKNVTDLIETISHSEQIGRLTSNKFTRVISMKSYLLFYEINQNTIEIISFWDNRQDLLKRKVK